MRSPPESSSATDAKPAAPRSTSDTSPASAIVPEVSAAMATSESDQRARPAQRAVCVERRNDHTRPGRRHARPVRADLEVAAQRAAEGRTALPVDGDVRAHASPIRFAPDRTERAARPAHARGAARRRGAARGRADRADLDPPAAGGRSEDAERRSEPTIHPEKDNGCGSNDRRRPAPRVLRTRSPWASQADERAAESTQDSAQRAARTRPRRRGRRRGTRQPPNGAAITDAPDVRRPLRWPPGRWPSVDQAAARSVTRAGTPPRGRSVAAAGSTVIGPSPTTSKRTRRVRVASANVPSRIAKWLPMQTRGPAPKGT